MDTVLPLASPAASTAILVGFTHAETPATPAAERMVTPLSSTLSRKDVPLTWMPATPSAPEVMKESFTLNNPPAKAGGFTVATKVAFRLKPVWPLLKQAEVICEFSFQVQGFGATL